MQASGTTRWVFDSLYGTKQFTKGAELQRPRKVPMRVEPKSYFGGWRGAARLNAGTAAQQVWGRARGRTWCVCLCVPRYHTWALCTEPVLGDGAVSARRAMMNAPSHVPNPSSSWPLPRLCLPLPP